MENITKSNVEISANIHAFWKKNGKVVREDHVKNIVVYAGIQSVLERLANTASPDLRITHAALGDSTTAPAVGDTVLGNELYRNAIISASVSGAGNALYIDALFDINETSGDFKEFGFVVDGTASPDTGDLWNHVAVNWSKDLDEQLFIRATFTITNKA